MIIKFHNIPGFDIDNIDQHMFGIHIADLPHRNSLLLIGIKYYFGTDSLLHQ